VSILPLRYVIEARDRCTLALAVSTDTPTRRRHVALHEFCAEPWFVFRTV
jgi:hypothetical protein